MKVLLIRHPRPLIDAGICYGRLDMPMDPAVSDTLAAIADAGTLQDARRVWTSPALRCDVLADLIARKLSVPKVSDARLLELDFGAWEGKAWDDVPRSDLDDWAADPAAFRAHGGESAAQLLDRVRAFHEDIRRDGEDCAVVSHGGPLKLLRALLQDRPIDFLAAAPPMGSIYTARTGD